MKRIIFATKNESKVREVREILKGLNAQILSLSDVDFTGEILESGETFEDNAKIKAKIVYDKYKLPTIADDSGLAVKQLNNEPGVYSARYAGKDAGDKDNNDKLLRNLSAHPAPHPAKFICAAVYYNGTDFYVVNGEVNGKIIDEERGTNGFGYDPLFVADGYTETMAELELMVKNKISHRYKAFAKLKDTLSEI